MKDNKSLLVGNNKKALTHKQSLYLEGIKSGKNKKESALLAGYSLESADNAKHVIEANIG